MAAPKGNATFSPTAEQQIPRYVHYVFGFSNRESDRAFGFMQYLCMTSALDVIQPERVYMHHSHAPTGFYWDQFAMRANASLVMVRHDDFKDVFGRSVDHFAHKADIVRLEAVYEHGGVYMDTDVLVIKDFARGALYGQQVVMGMESQPDLKPDTPPSGLCNAVILARPYAPFIRPFFTHSHTITCSLYSLRACHLGRWIETYKSFNKSQWAEHSVTKPWELAQAYPSEITVLNKFAFFWPIWSVTPSPFTSFISNECRAKKKRHDDHLRLVHRGMAYDFNKPDRLAPTRDAQYTYHLWHSAAWDRYLRYYDPDRIHNRGFKRGAEREEDGRSDESSFSRQARKHVSDDFRKAWRDAKARGEVSA